MAGASSDVRYKLEHLPKVDLHRHLEGSLRVGTLAEIVRSERLDLPSDESSLGELVQVSSGESRSTNAFLSKFEVLRRFYRSPEIIQRLTREAVADAALDGVSYLELRFTPAALGGVRQFPLQDVIDWVVEAANEEGDARDIQVRLIVSVNRHEPPSLAEQVARMSSERQARGVVGLDLAGDECEYSAEPFCEIFADARASGLGITVHAGEWAGPESVRHALEVMGADRIGHGVRVLEDPKIVAIARERRTLFEVCLTSNVHSGVIVHVAEHPLPLMIEAGLQLSLNTDDPGVSRIQLTDEYLLAIQDLGLSLESVKGLILAAAQAAFLTPREKASLEARLQSGLLDSD